MTRSHDTSVPMALLLVLAVAGTVMVSLFLAVSDSSLSRSAAGNGGDGLSFFSGLVATGTPRPTVLLPSPTGQPALAAGSGQQTGTPTATRGAMLPTCPDRPADWAAVAVQEGDTLAGLAAQTGISIHDLMAANCLTTEGLVSGLVIYIPPPPPAVADCLRLPDDWVAYRVRPGDTLFALARRHGTSVDELQRTNCLPDAILLAGEILYVPPVVIVVTNTPHPPRPTATRPPQPTRTPRPTASATAVASATPTPGLTATIPPSGTPGPSQTPGSSPTATPPISGSPSATPGTGTPPPSPTPLPTGTPPSPTPDPTAATTVTPAASATPAGSPTPAATNPPPTSVPPSPTPPAPTQPPPTNPPPPTQPPPTSPPPPTQPPPTNPPPPTTPPITPIP